MGDIGHTTYHLRREARDLFNDCERHLDEVGECEQEDITYVVICLITILGRIKQAQLKRAA